MSNPIDPRILEFISEHHVLTLSTCHDNASWCAHCFYAFIDDDMTLVVSSDRSTRHGNEALANPRVSGSIVLETNIVGKIQGIQFTGVMTEVAADASSRAKKRYLLRFPYAILKDTHLWTIELTHVKMTDNRLGFGTKLTWTRE